MDRLTGLLVRRGGLGRFMLVSLCAGLTVSTVTAPLGPQAPALAGAALLAVSIRLVLGGSTASSDRRSPQARFDDSRPRTAGAAHIPNGGGPAAAAVHWSVIVSLLVVCFLGGVAMGSFRAAALFGTSGEAPGSGEGRSWRGTVCVETLPRVFGDRLKLVASADEQRYLVILRGAGGLSSLDEGCLIRLTGRIRAARPADASSGFDEATYLRTLGVTSVIEARTPAGIAGRRDGWAGLVDGLRRRARSTLERGVDPERGRLLRAVVLGDREVLSSETVGRFRSSGLAHVLAVSGLHVAGLTGMVILIASRARLHRRWCLLLALALLAVFVPLTGSRPPVVRAGVMLSLILMSELVGRSREPWSAFFLAMALILLENPFVALGAGFQLSFGAVAAILLLAGRLERALEFLPATIATAAAVTLAATVGTLPVTAFVFGRVPLLGVVANLLVTPLLPVVMALGLASLVAGPVAGWAAPVLNLVASILLTYVDRVAAVFSTSPVMEGRSVGWVVAAIAGGGLGRLWWARSRWALEAVPARAVRRRRARVVAALVGAAVAAGMFGGGAHIVQEAVVARARSDWPRVTEIRVLDVGQGAAVLLRTPGGGAALFDAGPPGRDLAGRLRRLGVTGLDLVVLSHPHLDHYGGLRDLTGQIRVETLIDGLPGGAYLNGGGRHSALDRSGQEIQEYLDVRRVLVDNGARLMPLPERVQFGAAEVSFIPCTGAGEDKGAAAPWTSWDSYPADSDGQNDASLAAVIRSGAIAILLPGDAEAHELRRRRIGPVDILVVPHHGSAGGVDRPLLESLAPRMAIVPVGRNSFGHPAESVLSLLSAAGVPIMRTDVVGDVVVELDGDRALDHQTSAENVAREREVLSGPRNGWKTGLGLDEAPRAGVSHTR